MKKTKITINYDLLMDLRIDYAFKVLFIKNETRLLISLLNAIFLNKKIPRIIKSLKILNPYLEKESLDDKLSILDIRAELEDGTTVLIEMHMYGLDDLKAKMLRSWARAYGEKLEPKGKYKEQPPTIAIAFTDGTIGALENNSKTKIHRICKILDCEDFSVFTNAMELHYIDMKAFAKAVNVANSLNINEEMIFAKWLSIITQKDIKNKAIIEKAYNCEEDIFMAMTALSIQSEGKIIRQAYARREDELFYFNKNRYEKEQAEKTAMELLAKNEQLFAEKNLAMAEIEILRKKLAMYEQN